MNVGAVIQARMTSTRLPGKVMMELAGRPMLWHVVERVRAAKRLDSVVLAITTNADDEALASLADEMNCKYFRGDENDVLARYLGAAAENHLDLIVRVTSDCPLIDPSTIDSLVGSHISSGADYSSNTLQRTYPRGLDVEIFSACLLKEIDRVATQTFEREHVTPAFYKNPDRFELNNLEAPPELARPDFRLCVDTAEDFRLISKIYGALYERGSIIDIRSAIQYLDNNPDIAKINREIVQKPLVDG